MDWQNRAHFLAMAARLMRRILVDSARARRYQKRGGGDVRITLDEGLSSPATGSRIWWRSTMRWGAWRRWMSDEVRSSSCAIFGGFTVEETAVVLKVSPDTVMRDSRLAKAWLARERHRRQIT